MPTGWNSDLSLTLSWLLCGGHEPTGGVKSEIMTFVSRCPDSFLLSQSKITEVCFNFKTIIWGKIFNFDHVYYFKKLCCFDFSTEVKTSLMLLNCTGLVRGVLRAFLKREMNVTMWN